MNSGARRPVGDSKISRFLRVLQGTEAARRYPTPGLDAYYWTGGAPKACSVANISASGVYVFTQERWMVGSMMPMTLQRSAAPGREVEDWIAVIAKVARRGRDGFGLVFVFSGAAQQFSSEIPPERIADKRALKQFLVQLKLPETHE